MEQREVIPEFTKTLIHHTWDVCFEEMSILLQRLSGRYNEGMRKYGVPLTTHNGRNPTLDAWEETADLCLYLEQCFMETQDDSYKMMQADAIRLLVQLSQKLQK